MGVVVAASVAPFVPESYGIRHLIIGLLGGVTAYNSHVLAPTDRIPSVALSTGAFVVLFALAEAVAHLLNSPFADPFDASVAIIGFALLATAVFALFEYERLRPTEPIRTVENGGLTVVPDGGAAIPPDDGEPLADGGRADPLAQRTVIRIGPNARLVRRGPGTDSEVES